MQNDPGITDEEAAAMRAQLAAYDQQRMAETMQAQIAEQAARDVKLAPLRAIVDREAYGSIADDLRGILRDFVDEEPLFGMMKALADIMPKLKDRAAQ